jgi:hypothetical protein
LFCFWFCSFKVVPVEAAYRYERETAGQSAAMAGAESKPTNASMISGLTAVQTAAVHLFWAIGNAGDDVVVFDRVFRPKELVRDKIEVGGGEQSRT